MTCIVAMIDDNGVGHIACDGISSNNYTKNLIENKKIFKKGDILVGYTTSFRMGQLIQYKLVLPEVCVGDTIESWLYVKFIDAIKLCFSSNGFSEIKSNVEEGGNFIFIYKGRLFEMQDDYSIIEPTDKFASCGSGCYYAQASIEALKNITKMKPREILESSIKIAEKYITTVGGRIDYLNDSEK